MQLGLFSNAETPPSHALPNENGVYSRDDAETLTLPMGGKGKGYRGVPSAAISLLHVEQGWMVACEANIDMFCGMGEPLSGTGGFMPDRAAALAEGVKTLRRYLEKDRTWPASAVKDAGRILGWLETVQ